MVTCKNGLPCWYNKDRIEATCPYSKLRLYGPTLCEFPDRACASVFAGHFMPDLVDALAKHNSMDRIGSMTKEHCRVDQNVVGTPRWPEGENPAFDCVTFLREPLDRSISWYQDKLIDTGAATTKFINLSMSERLHVLRHHNVGGHQTAWLANIDLHEETNPHAALAAAKAMVDRCVVGIFEKRSASNELIGATFPWIHMPLENNVPHLHPSSHMRVADFSPSEQEQLRHILQPDLTLYHYALQQFNLRWQNFVRAKASGGSYQTC